MTGQYYEANCGNCGKMLYGTTKGIWVGEVKCIRCGADNVFADSTEQPDGDIAGRLVGTFHGTVHTSPLAVVSGR